MCWFHDYAVRYKVLALKNGFEFPLCSLCLQITFVYCSELMVTLKLKTDRKESSEWKPKISTEKQTRRAFSVWKPYLSLYTKMPMVQMKRYPKSTDNEITEEIKIMRSRTPLHTMQKSRMDRVCNPHTGLGSFFPNLQQPAHFHDYNDTWRWKKLASTTTNAQQFLINYARGKSGSSFRPPRKITLQNCCQMQIKEFAIRHDGRKHYRAVSDC